jgi:hypothetical protein
MKKKIFGWVFLAATATAYVSATFILLDKIEKLNKITDNLTERARQL